MSGLRHAAVTTTSCGSMRRSPCASTSATACRCATCSTGATRRTRTLATARRRAERSVSSTPTSGTTVSVSSTDPSVARVARCPRKRNDVADVAKPRGVSDGALESQPEAGVRHGSVASQVAIPPVVSAVETRVGHARIEDVEPLLALAASDDLADPGREHAHRPLRISLGQVALVLGLQVGAEAHRELEALRGFTEHANRLRVIHANELGVDDARELRDDALFDALVEEREIVGALAQH